MNNKKTLSGLYYRYGKIKDEEIREYLERFVLVTLVRNEITDKNEYFPLSDASMKKIKANPRGVSLTLKT